MNSKYALLLPFFLFFAGIAPVHAADLDEMKKALEGMPAKNPGAEAAAPKPQTQTLPQAGDKKSESRKDYRLQAGDKLNLKIYPEDQFIKSAELQVSPDGNITLPLVGKVAVAGMTLGEAVQMLEQIIDKDYIASPEVSIDILESKQKSFVILGQIKKPGTYQFPAGNMSISLLEAISMAGGFSDIANIKKIKVLRKEGNTKQTLQANAEAIIGGAEPDIRIQEGDVVNVSESIF